MATSNLAFHITRSTPAGKTSHKKLRIVHPSKVPGISFEAPLRQSLAKSIQSGSVSMLPRYMGVNGHVQEFMRALLIPRPWKIGLLLFLTGATIGFSLGNLPIFGHLSAAEFASYLYVDEITDVEQWL